MTKIDKCYAKILEKLVFLYFAQSESLCFVYNSHKIKLNYLQKLTVTLLNFFTNFTFNNYISYQ